MPRSAATEGTRSEFDWAVDRYAGFPDAKEQLMNASTKINARVVALACAMILLATGAAQAAAIVAWGHSPARDRVYFQFSTDVAPDAYRAIVRQPGVGIVAATPVRHVHYASTGFSDQVAGLSPSTRYVLIVRVRWVHGGPWTTERVERFRTLP
jgi:hypothetical protein